MSRNASRRRTSRRNEKSLASGYGKFPCLLNVSVPPRHSPLRCRRVDARCATRASAAPRATALCRPMPCRHHLLCRSPSRSETLMHRNRQRSAAFSLITNRSCKPQSGRYYREHSDGVNRRFSRGRIRASHPGRFRLLHPTVSPWVPDHKELPLELIQACPGQPAATCASRSLSDWCPPTAAAPQRHLSAIVSLT